AARGPRGRGRRARRLGAVAVAADGEEACALRGQPRLLQLERGQCLCRARGGGGRRTRPRAHEPHSRGTSGGQSQPHRAGAGAWQTGDVAPVHGAGTLGAGRSGSAAAGDLPGAPGPWRRPGLAASALSSRPSAWRHRG
ncbi:unnamed protein product, partial [Effrenium voratum]